MAAAADPLGAHLGVGLHPDDDPADRPHRPVDGRLQGASRARSPGSTRSTSPRPSRRSGWALVSIVFYVGLTLISENILGDSIAAVGLMIAFYYGLTGFARLVLPQDHVVERPRLRDAGPVAVLWAARCCWVAFVWRPGRTPTRRTATTTLGGHRRGLLIGIGALLVGVVLMVHLQARPPRLLPRRDAAEAQLHDLILHGAGGIRHGGRRLPDSGPMPTVIAPDLSNLPPGAGAVDPVTGQGVHPRRVEDAYARRGPRLSGPEPTRVPGSTGRSQVDGAVHPGAVTPMPDLLVEAEGAGAGVGRQRGPAAPWPRADANASTSRACASPRPRWSRRTASRAMKPRRRRRRPSARSDGADDRAGRVG